MREVQVRLRVVLGNSQFFSLMSDTPSLTEQLAARVKKFASSMNLSQRQVCEVLKLNEGTFSRFLSSKGQLSPEDTLKVLRLTSLSRRDLDLKLGQRTTSKIQHLQVKGEQMTFADTGGWVPGRTSDPNDLNEGIEVKSASNLEDIDDELSCVLAQLNGLHQKAIDVINRYVAKKAKPNRNGITEGPRHIDDNTRSRTAGPRPDRFSRK